MKTAKSRKTIPLSPAVVELLKAQRKAQRVEQFRAANNWEGPGYVFTTQTGRPVEPRNLRRDLATAPKKANLENVGVHALRHSAVPMMLDNGEKLKTVSEALGHARTSITADIYDHVSEDTSRAAMDNLSAVLGF